MRSSFFFLFNKLKKKLFCSISYFSFKHSLINFIVVNTTKTSVRQFEKLVFFLKSLLFSSKTFGLKIFNFAKAICLGWGRSSFGGVLVVSITVIPFKCKSFKPVRKLFWYLKFQVLSFGFSILQAKIVLEILPWNDELELKPGKPNIKNLKWVTRLTKV